MLYVCYVLWSCSRNKTYIGITNKFKNRLRKHNGIIKGGAKATRSGRPWILLFYIGFFSSKGPSLSVESFLKKETNKKRFRPNERREKMIELGKDICKKYGYTFRREEVVENSWDRKSNNRKQKQRKPEKRVPCASKAAAPRQDSK